MSKVKDIQESIELLLSSRNRSATQLQLDGSSSRGVHLLTNLEVLKVVKEVWCFADWLWTVDQETSCTLLERSGGSAKGLDCLLSTLWHEGTNHLGIDVALVVDTSGSGAVGMDHDFGVKLRNLMKLLVNSWELLAVPVEELEVLFSIELLQL